MLHWHILSVNIKKMTDVKELAKDLTKMAPRSAYERLAGFAIIARAIDKGRATIVGNNGEYNFDCPVDNMLFSFKGIEGNEFRAQLESGKSDEEIVEWFKQAGQSKTEEEAKEWSDRFKSDFSYSTNPEKKDWFRGECERLGLDPDKTTLFDMLDVDDKVTFENK